MQLLVGNMQHSMGSNSPQDPEEYGVKATLVLAALFPST